MKSPADRARDFAYRHGKKWQAGDFAEGDEAKQQFWKWWGFIHGAAFGWLQGFKAGKKRF